MAAKISGDTSPAILGLWRLLDGYCGSVGMNGDVPLALAGLILLRWVDFQDAEREAVAAFEGVEYKPLLPSSLHWRAWQSLGDTSAQHLVVTTEVLPRLFDGRCGNPLLENLRRASAAFDALKRLDPGLFSDMTRWLAEQPFESPADRRALLATFDETLERTAEKRSGEFATPAAVAHLMVDLATPAPGERVYDPCMGSASLLTRALEFAQVRVSPGMHRSGAASLQLFGGELNPAMYAIAFTRLVLAGIDNPTIDLGDSLLRDSQINPEREGYDLILANPPFGHRVDPQTLLSYPIPVSDATWCFIQHALAQLRPRGRAVILVPEGVLFRGGADQRLREWLITQHTVERVIGLPRGTFKGTAIKASILVIRRGGTTREVTMADVDSEHLAKSSTVAALALSTASAPSLAIMGPVGLLAVPLLFAGAAWLASRKNKDAEGSPEALPSDMTWTISAEQLRDYDFDLTPRRREKGALDKALEQLSGSVNLVPLKELCIIRLGKDIRSDELRPQPGPDEESVGFIRIRDLNLGEIRRPALWAEQGANQNVPSRWRTRHGDVLLSRSGTIGKAALVTNGAVGCAVSSRLFILTPDQESLDPHYLVAYLATPECQEYLRSQAQGTSIQNISIKAVANLQIPLPEIGVQQRLGALYRGKSEELIKQIIRLLLRTERDVVEDWLLQVHQEMLADEAELKAENREVLIRRLVQVVDKARPLRNNLVHDMGDQATDHATWFLTFYRVLEPLLGIDSLTAGMTQFHLLLAAMQGIQESTQGGGVSSQPNLGREVADRLHKWLAALLDGLRSLTRPVVELRESDLESGKQGTVVVRIWNSGPLAVRDLRITSRPDWGQHKIAFIEPDTAEDVTFRGSVPDGAKELTLEVILEAKTFDQVGIKAIRSEFKLAVDEPELENSQEDFGSSPYVAGDPISPVRKDLFFGRDDLIDQICRQVAAVGNVVLLEGNRRAGKSSILSQLQGIGPVLGWLGVHCSLQGVETAAGVIGLPTVEVFREFARSIAKALVAAFDEVPLPDGSIVKRGRALGISKACRQGISEESPFGDFRDYLETCLERTDHEGIGILLMIDEFDKLQEGIDSGTTSAQLPENLRFLIQTYPRFSAILTGSRRLKRMREEYFSVLFGLGTRFGVSALPAEAARRLVVEPVAGRLLYSEESVAEIVRLTASQPYMLQSLCNRIFDRAVQSRRRSVSLNEVQQACAEFVADNEHFASLWGYTGNERRRLTLWLCHRGDADSQPVRFGLLREMLLSHGVLAEEEQLVTDIEHLRELELLDYDEQRGSYSLTIPLMGMWMERQHDPAALIARAKRESEDEHE